MAKYRKKPVVIDAVQYDGYNKDAIPCLCNCTGEGNPHIHTLEGSLYASPGDWIIRGVKGEYYPCKPAIFAATYEPV
jgi:hypothetical protein